MTGEIKDDVTKKYFQTFWYFWFKVLQSDEKRYLEFSQERLRLEDLGDPTLARSCGKRSF